MARKAKAAAPPPVIEEFPLPPVPSVWRDGPAASHLALIYRADQFRTLFVSTYERESGRIPTQIYTERFQQQRSEINPHYVALNFINRAREGTLSLRAHEERELIAMLNKAELMKLSEKQLAAEYVKVMGSGPKKIATAKKEERIDEMIAKLGERAAQQTETEASAASAAPEPEQDNPEKESSMATTKKAKKGKAAKEPKTKKTAAPKAKKEPKAKKAPPADGNPFREGSMKREAWTYFQRTQDRAKFIEKVISLGATESTAASWYSSFSRM